MNKLFYQCSMVNIYDRDDKIDIYTDYTFHIIIISTYSSGPLDLTETENVYFIDELCDNLLENGYVHCSLSGNELY